MRKLSLLGLVLLAASAVTAAVMPKDKSDKDAGAINSLTLTTGDVNGNELTCVTTAAASVQCQRTATANTTTTADPDVTSTAGALSTFANGGAGSTNAGLAPHPNTSGSPS